MKLILLLFPVFLMSCVVKPTYRGADGSILTAGVSIWTKNSTETTTVEHPNGTKMSYATTNHDETIVPGRVISSQTTLGLARYAKDAFGMGEKTKVDLGAQDVTKHGVSTAADVDKAKLLVPVEEAAPAAASVINPATGLQSP